MGSRLIDRFDAACFQPAWAGICRREYIVTRASDMMMSDHGFDANVCGGSEVLGGGGGVWSPFLIRFGSIFVAMISTRC